MTWWACHGFPSQKWERKAIYGNYKDLCKKVVKAGKRFMRCPGKKDKFLGEFCKKTIEERNNRETLVKTCGGKTWEVAKCQRIQKDKQWYRKCGKNYMELVKSENSKEE